METRRAREGYYEARKLYVTDLHRPALEQVSRKLGIPIRQPKGGISETDG